MVALFYYWPQIRAFLLRLYEANRKERKEVIPYEEVVVYDDDMGAIYRVALPLSDLYEYLGAPARYICDSNAARLIGAGCGAGIGLLVFGLVGWFFLMPSLGMVVMLMLCFALSLFMAFPGWVVAPRWGPKPQWLAYRKGKELGAFNVSKFVQPDDPEASFVAELISMRDVKLIMSGGQSKTQQYALVAIVTLIVCLVVALFFVSQAVS